jgi:hypothetical protein
MGLLDMLATPLKGFSQWQKQQSAASAQRARAEQDRRQAFLHDLMEEFSDSEHIVPKSYHELSIGEAKAAKTPALEYFHATATVRVHHLLSNDIMRRAALIRAYGMRFDDLEEGETGEIIDVKPRDQQAIEHGAVNLGPVSEFIGAEGTQWRFFIELSYTAALSSGRGGIQTRHFVVDSVL